MKCILTIVVPLIVVELFASEFRQERAIVEVCNPKWMSDCFCITRRIKRGEPYKTNCTITSLYQWGNNVTMKVVIQRDGFPELIVLKLKTCEALKVEWLSKFLEVYSNVYMSECPLVAGRYIFNNTVFPPKNMPQYVRSFMKGRFKSQVILQKTKTEEIIIKGSIVLYS